MAALSLVIFLTGCSTRPKTELIPKAYIQPEIDSLRLKLSLTSHSPQGKVEKVSGTLWAVPEQRYRLEISGTMGMSVASVLWDKEFWLFNFNTMEKHQKGIGDLLMVPDSPLPPLSIHKVLAPCWGEWIESESSSIKFAKHYGETWIEQINYPEEQIMMKFGKPELLDSLVIPSYLEYYHQKQKLLTITVKEVKRDLSWSPSVWRLRPVGKALN